LCGADDAAAALAGASGVDQHQPDALNGLIFSRNDPTRGGIDRSVGGIYAAYSTGAVQIAGRPLCHTGKAERSACRICLASVRQTLPHDGIFRSGQKYFLINNNNIDHADYWHGDCVGPSDMTERTP